MTYWAESLREQKSDVNYFNVTWYTSPRGRILTVLATLSSTFFPYKTGLHSPFT